MRVHYFITTFIIWAGVLTGCGSSGSSGVQHRGWAVGSNTDGYGVIIYTENSGKVWERQGDAASIPDVEINDVSAADRMHAWAVGGSGDDGNGSVYGTILYTENGGSDWKRQGSAATVPDTEFAGVSAIDKERAWAVGTGGEIMYTDDAGGHWARQDDDQFADVFFQMVSAVDAENVWAAGGFSSGAFIARTRNGRDWEQVNIDIFGDVEGFIDIHALSNDVVWAVGTGGTVAITRNGGETWVRTGPGGILHVNGVCALDEKRAWLAVDSYTLYYTDDGGFTWVQQDIPEGGGEIPALSGAYMGVTAVDSDHAWLVGLNSPQMAQKPIIKYTDDGGSTWVEQTSAANTELRRVSFVGDVRP